MQLVSKINGRIKNRKFRKYAFGCCISGIFGFILFLNIQTPLLGDDYTYKLIFDSSEPIRSFSDIVESQQIHYEKWGGRVVVHTIAQLLLQLPSLVLDLLNSVAFITLLLLIYLHINYKKHFSVSILLGIFFLLWFLEPFAETILWITGSANYMWGTIIILAFLLPYRCYSNKQAEPLNNLIRTALMFPAGIIAGWTNENTGAGLIVIIISFLIYYKNQQWIIPKWVYSGFIGVLIGYALMITAPGNAVRSHEVNIGLFSIIYNTFRHTQALLNNLGLFNLVLIVLLYMVSKESSLCKKQIIWKSVIFFLGMLASVYAMILSPSFPERAWFGLIIFNIIALGIVLVNIESPLIRKTKYGFIILALLLFSFNLYDVLKDISHVNKTLTQREAYILKSKEEGKKLIYIDKYEVSTKYAMPDPVYAEPLMPRYYGIEVKYKK